jgi:hypothetical protein
MLLAEEENWVEIPKDEVDVDESAQEKDPPSIDKFLIEVKKAISLGT